MKFEFSREILQKKCQISYFIKILLVWDWVDSCGHEVRHDDARRADKSLARLVRNQARKHDRDACDFNNMETWTLMKFFFLQDKAPKEIHAILREKLSCFFPGRAKDLSAPLQYLYAILRRQA